MKRERASGGRVAGCLMCGSLLCATLCACARFGTGGTGERVVPAQRLREIEATTMEDLSASPPTTAPTTLRTLAAPTAEVPLSIAESRMLALQNNLELRVELLNPTIARESISEERARFESLFVANADYSTSDTPTATRLTGSQANAFRADAGVEIPLMTGGLVRLTLPVERFETDNQFATLNPAYTSDFAASISHPLLRGAGTEVTSHGIRIAFYQNQATEARTKLEVIRILADVDRLYWRLYAARRELEVRKKEYDLATAQLERARRQAAAGVVAEVEIVRAESGVADRLEGIIISENLLRDRQRELKRILNEPGLEMGGGAVIVPTSDPSAVFYDLEPERLVEVALQQRMEMLELELRIAQESSSVAFARNGMLPLVNVDYTYNINGLGASFEESFRMLRERDFEDHRLGVRMEVPIGNEAARSRLRRALASRLQQIASKDLRASLIAKEVLDAIDQLEANWQRILAAQQRVVLAARVVDLETRQFALGLRTSTEVLEAQTRLADAQLSEIAAVTEYQIAQIDIAFATGTVLGSAAVQWEPALGVEE